MVLQLRHRLASHGRVTQQLPPKRLGHTLVVQNGMGNKGQEAKKQG